MAQDKLELSLLLDYYGSFLTEKQRELYLAMTREGLTLREFARRKGIGIRAAFDLKAAVQKKFQRIFGAVLNKQQKDVRCKVKGSIRPLHCTLKTE